MHNLKYSIIFLYFTASSFTFASLNIKDIGKLYHVKFLTSKTLILGGKKGAIIVDYDDQKQKLISREKIIDKQIDTIVISKNAKFIGLSWRKEKHKETFQAFYNIVTKELHPLKISNLVFTVPLIFDPRSNNLFAHNAENCLNTIVKIILFKHIL